MLSGLFGKTRADVTVREIVFTYLIKPAEHLTVAGLAEIKVGNCFLPWEFTLRCNKAEITTEEVKEAIESLSDSHGFKGLGALGAGADSFCQTPVGDIVIQDPCRGAIWKYGTPSEWRKHGETFLCCSQKTQAEDTARKAGTMSANIRFCTSCEPNLRLGQRPGYGVNGPEPNVFSKVPEVTLCFWITKILATTLGETGGDAVSMSMGLGYLAGTAIFSAFFIAAVVVQASSKTFRPILYWTTIIATTTVGTTLADFSARSLGIGYAGGTVALLALLLTSLFLWRRTLGTVAVDSVVSPRSEAFYWVTIMFSQTLGTALGDWAADTAGWGYDGAAFIFGALLAAVAVAYYLTKVSRVVLFWTAFILTRPLGAVVGDFLDKPVNDGGLALSRYSASAVLLALIALGVFLFPQRPAKHQMPL